LRAKLRLRRFTEPVEEGHSTPVAGKRGRADNSSRIRLLFTDRPCPGMSSGSRGSPGPSVRRELVDFGAEAGLPVRQAAPPGCWSRGPTSSWLCPTGHVSSSTCRSCRQGRGGRCWWGPWASVAFCSAFIPANRAGTLWLRSGAVPRNPQARRPRCGEGGPHSRRSRGSAGWLPEHAIHPQEPFLDSRPASGIDRIGHPTGDGFITSRGTQNSRIPHGLRCCHPHAPSVSHPTGHATRRIPRVWWMAPAAADRAAKDRP
jgi:hypothetical protein